MRDKTVLVTGASGGIGRQTALALAKLGARVVVTGRSRARGEAAVVGITELSGKCFRVDCDQVPGQPRFSMRSRASRCGRSSKISARLSELVALPDKRINVIRRSAPVG